MKVSPKRYRPPLLLCATEPLTPAVAKKKCKSYSYNEATQSCLWSPEGFGYDPGWTYYSKEKTGRNHSQKTFESTATMHLTDMTSLCVPGEYVPIPGLVYKSQKERVVITSDKKLCQTKCDEGLVPRDACLSSINMVCIPQINNALHLPTP